MIHYTYKVYDYCYALCVVHCLIGRPASVDLYCSHQSVYTIKCTWIVPYTLPSMDITGYSINISNTTSNLIMMTVNVTEYTYNVSEFGNYTVSVVATNGELEGIKDKTVFNVPEGRKMRDN